MEIEELLKPRYKVIAEYPQGFFKEGEIVYTFCDAKSPYRTWYISTEENGRVWQHGSCEKYPKVFKKLEWWEERKETDMPEYVKLNPKNKEDYPTVSLKEIYKVKKWSGGFFYKMERKTHWSGTANGM